jgi:hypothetical protein
MPRVKFLGTIRLMPRTLKKNRFDDDLPRSTAHSKYCRRETWSAMFSRNVSPSYECALRRSLCNRYCDTTGRPIPA